MRFCSRWAPVGLLAVLVGAHALDLFVSEIPFYCCPGSPRDPGRVLWNLQGHPAATLRYFLSDWRSDKPGWAGPAVLVLLVAYAVVLVRSALLVQERWLRQVPGAQESAP